MLNTIIIEDERPALQNLLQVLDEVSPEINVICTLSTVRESIEYLSKPVNADLIFSDVQLPDGLSFEIFERLSSKIPVIFITGFDEFIMNAFSHNGIDFLLKPVDKEEVQRAILKYRMLEKHFTSSVPAVRNLYQQMQSARKKTRLVVRKGIENLALKLEDIVLFYTENKIVYVIDKYGKKYLADKTLGDLEQDLDENHFFRANRQYIINITYVKSYKTYEKVKLRVDLDLPELNHCIIISQETAPAFRKWIFEA